MDELQIARSTAVILDRLRNSSSGEQTPVPDKRFSGGGRLSEDELEFAKLRTMTYELAASRACEASRDDLATVVRETEFRVAALLARILAGTVDPVLGELEKVVVLEENGEVCGVCQEEMEDVDEVRAMGCLHKFHAFCIWKWLRETNTCPLCRFSHAKLAAV